MPVLPTTSPAPASTKRGRAPLSVMIAAWSAPILVAVDFALLAVVPVTVVLVRSLRRSRLRALRWPAGLLAAVYTTPLTLWLLDPARAGSLSKHIEWVWVALIVAASAVVLLTLHTRPGRPSTDELEG